MMYRHGIKQAKLDSVDFLMVLLTRFGLCSKSKGMRIFQHYRQNIFYQHFVASHMEMAHIEKILRDER